MNTEPDSKHSRQTGEFRWVVFLFTDIEDCTSQWERAGGEFRKVLEAHHALVREHVRHSGGRELSEAGDGFLIAFDDVQRATDCAVDIQRGIRAMPVPTSVGALRVRMGLHVGEVETRESGGYRGLVLNRAARIRDAAHGGQVLCSHALAQALEGSRELVELGLFRLRGVAAPERIHQLCWPEMPQRGFPAPRLQPAFSNNLPPSFTRFFGREVEIARLREWLLGHREKTATGGRSGGQLVTLTGPGGTGKTRLSLAVAESLLDEFSHAVWFVPLADLIDAERLPTTVRDVMRLTPEAGKEPLEQVLAALTAQPALLVLDNFEHLAQDGAAFVHTLLSRLPSLRCLVTSRQRLNLPGEREYEVPPLPVPATNAASANEVLAFESVQLFVDRARSARSGFEFTRRNAAAVAELCQKLEGVPLAIELAAARADVATPREMIEQLDERLDAFWINRSDIPPRHRSLRAAIDWSFDFLPPALQDFFVNLSVFRGGWTDEAAAKVAAPPGLGSVTGTARRALGELRAASLISATEQGERLRFSMLETLRHYGEERLRASAREEDVRQRHANFAWHLAEQAEAFLHSDQQAAWLDRLQEEYANLLAAIGYAQRDEIGSRIAAALPYFWFLRGHLREGRRVLAELLGAMVACGTKVEAGVHNAAGILALAAGDLPKAETEFSAAKEIFQKLGEERNIAGMLTNLGSVAKQRGDYSGCELHYAEALKLYDRLNMAPYRARLLSNLGAMGVEQNDPRARAWLEEALICLHEAGDEFAVANILHNLGELSAKEGKVREAMRYLRRSLVLRRKTGDLGLTAETWATLAFVAITAGKIDAAVRWLGAVQSMRENFEIEVTPATQAQMDHWVERSGKELPRAHFHHLWGRGRLLARRWNRQRETSHGT